MGRIQRHSNAEIWSLMVEEGHRRSAFDPYSLSSRTFDRKSRVKRLSDLHVNVIAMPGDRQIR
jgi:hypothetical protein